MRHNFIRTMIAAAAMASAASCTDLDVDVKSQYTEYPTESEVALEAKMADVYYAFRSVLGNKYNRYQTFASDEASGLTQFQRDRPVIYLSIRRLRFSVFSVGTTDFNQEADFPV